MTYSSQSNSYGKTPFQQSVQWQRAVMQRDGQTGALTPVALQPNTPAQPDQDKHPNDAAPLPPQAVAKDHLQQAAGAAGAAVGQTANDVNEGLAGFVKKASDGLINAQMFDEAGQFLNGKEKVVAGLVGLGGYSAFLAAAHSMAGLDPYMGSLIPQRLEKAKNSPMAKVARMVDKLAPNTLTPGSLKGKTPDWLRAYLGDMPEDEYTQYYIKQHNKAVNATINKLAKGSLTPGTLTHTYAKTFEHINQALMNGNYLHHLTPDEMRQLTKNVATPYAEHSPAQYINDAQLKPLFKKTYEKAVNAYHAEKSIHAGLQAQIKQYEAKLASLENSPQDEAGMKAIKGIREQLSKLRTAFDESAAKRSQLEDALRQEGKNPIKEIGQTMKRVFHDEPVNIIPHFETALKEQPHRVARLLETLDDSETSHKLMGAIVGYVADKNEYSVQDQYLELMHKRLFNPAFRMIFLPVHYGTNMGVLDAETGQAITKGNLPSIAHAQATVGKVSTIGRKAFTNFPGGRWISRITTSDQAVPGMKEKALREIHANRPLWENLIGHDALESGIKALNDAKTVNDFFHANQHVSGKAGLALHDMHTLHKVLPRSLKRLNQSIGEHRQFITNQTKLSEAWGVKGAGRSIASSWLGMIDMVKFNLHATPSETSELKARALASADTSGHAILKHTKNFLLSSAGSGGDRIIFTLGAIMTFSSAAAAWIAAGKAEGKKDDVKEKGKAALRATATIAVPFIGASQIVTFANRGNPLGRLMGGHYLTSAFPPSPFKIHWLTGAGALIALPIQFWLNGLLRTKLEKGVDAVTGGPPKYVEDMKNLQKAKYAITLIQDERYDKLKREDVDLIRRYPKAMKESKATLTEDQLKLAERMAGQKAAKAITPEEAALMYTLLHKGSAQTPAALPSVSTAPSPTKKPSK
jgi:hypothetical protein